MGVYENARKATKEKILNEFWKLYKRKPIEKITVRELAAVCHVQRGTFYNHFQDIYAVLEEIEDRLLKGIDKTEEAYKGSDGSLKAFTGIISSCYSSKKEREYIKVLALEGRDPAFAAKYMDAIKRFVYEILGLNVNACMEEKERVLLETSMHSIIYILLSGMCSSALSVDEVNEFIIGLMQNGYYATLGERFKIGGLSVTETEGE